MCLEKINREPLFARLSSLVVNEKKITPKT